MGLLTPEQLTGLTDEQLRELVVKQQAENTQLQKENDTLSDQLADASATGGKDIVVTISKKKYQVLVPRFRFNDQVYGHADLEKNGLGDAILKVEGQQILAAL